MRLLKYIVRTNHETTFNKQQQQLRENALRKT